MFIYLLPFVLFALILIPLVPVLKGTVTAISAKRRIVLNIASFVVLCIGFTVFTFAMPASAATAAETAVAATVSIGKGIGLIAAALSMGISSIGAGIAIAAAASSAIGATSEDPKMFVKSIIFVALGESIALFGFLVSILIIGKV